MKEGRGGNHQETDKKDREGCVGQGSLNRAADWLRLTLDSGGLGVYHIPKVRGLRSVVSSPAGFRAQTIFGRSIRNFKQFYTQSLLHIFTQNLAQREKPASRKQKYFRFHFCENPKWRPAAILKTHKSPQGRLSLSTDGDKCAMVNFGRNEQKVT